MPRSYYDELHDKYSDILINKAGTRYERLAAIVFKILSESNVVIHDVSMRGESDVSHQIDVKISRDGLESHTLIECKDYDVSGNKIGLDVVRNFSSVIDDAGPAQGIILTCNGFTRDAAKFAKWKGIKLCVLRAHNDEDWDGFIKEVRIRIMYIIPLNPEVTMVISDKDEHEKMADLAANALAEGGGVHSTDRIFFSDGNNNVQFNEFLTKKMNDAINFEENRDLIEIEVPSDGWRLTDGGGRVVKFDSMKLKFQVGKDLRESIVTSSRIAELILKGFGDDDIIIWDDQLSRFKIDPDTGEVVQ